MSIKDFDIIQELGKGAFGTVYKVRRIKDNQIYALKKVIMNKLKQKEKENSLNEIRILASISHQNIVAYKDAFYDQELFALCIVTEFADDGDLEKKINEHIKKKTNFSETQIFSIFIQILNGLKSLHDQKIMHRDIKAANMLLFKDGFVKIGDMNVSKVIKHGLMNTQTGTPYYASPEVWNNKPYDCKSDIWSLGCLLYEMTTLKAPFRGNSMKNLFEKVMKGTYDPISGFYSKNLSEIIKSMLMLNPQLRPDCDAILKMICKKTTKLSFNFPLEYEANANGQNYFKNFKNELEGKNELNDNNNLSNNSVNKSQFKLVDHYNNKKNDFKRDNEIKDKTQIELLQTIKIPKKLNEINGMLPKSNYKKKILSTSINYESNAKYNDISLPGLLNKSSNENNNLNILKEININRNASKILNDLRINYRPISSDNRPKNIENNSVNYNSNKNQGSINGINSGQNYQRINPSPNNYINNNFNKRNVTHINNPLRNVVNNKTPIIVNQISSKIDKINIVNYNVELLERLANLNNLTNNSNNDNQVLEEKGNSKNNNNNIINSDLSFNNNNNDLANEKNKVSLAGIKNNSTLSPIKSNIGNFYMRKNMDKITSLKIQTNEELMQNNFKNKLNNINNIDKLIPGNPNIISNQILKTENSSEAVSNDNQLKKLLDPLTLNLDKNIKLKRIPAKNMDLNNLEDIQNTIKQSQNELNMILNRNFVNEYVPFNTQSTKNKNRINLFANRNFIVSAEKNNNDPTNQENTIKNTDANDESVVYMNTDINNNEQKIKNLKRNNSALYNRENPFNTPAKNKFNNIKIDLENNNFKKDPAYVNANDPELSNHHIQTDLEQKSKSSLDKEIEENIVSSLSKSSKKVNTLNFVKEISQNKPNVSGKQIQETSMEKIGKNPLNENFSTINSKNRVYSSIPMHQKNNSNNIKMILNPNLIEEKNSNDYNKQKHIDVSNANNELESSELLNSDNKEASSELKRVKSYEEKTSKTVENQIEKQENHQTDYNNIRIDNQYNVNNLYNEEMKVSEKQVKNRIYSANQKIPISLVEQHNLKANYLKNQLKLKKNPFSNSSEKPKNDQDFPAINNNSVSIKGNKKNKENLVAYPKMVQSKGKNNNFKIEEGNNSINNNNNNSKLNNPRTPNNFTVKRIDLNLNFPIEGREAESNFPSKHNNIPKIIDNRNSANFRNINKSRLKENLRNLSKEKSLFSNKNNNEQNRKSPLLDNRNTTKENDNSFFEENKEIQFDNSKMNNFEYSFMEKKSKNNSQRKLEMPNIPSNNVSKNKSSHLLKSEDNSHIIKNVDNIYNTYENYEDGSSRKKEHSALPKIPKYYGANSNNANGRKLKINLPNLKKDFSLNSNYGLSPINNPSYSSNNKDRLINLSTNDNLNTNPNNNYLNTSSNNRSNYIEKNYKYSPINASAPVANLLSIKTPINNFSKIKKIVYVNGNQ